MSHNEFPGTPRHQTLLAAIRDYYAEDSRVRAVIAFGSLARGNWYPRSDLDLDVIIADDVTLDVAVEVQALCTALQSVGEEAALIIADEDEADVVLASLMRFSIRYHTLATTHPNIVDDMLILGGSLDHATIRAAGQANRQPDDTDPQKLLDQCLRYALETAVAVEQGRLWLALEVLGRARAALMQIYAHSQGNSRYVHAMDVAAPELQARLGAAVPECNAGAIITALGHLLEIIEDDGADFGIDAPLITLLHQRLICYIRSSFVL